MNASSKKKIRLVITALAPIPVGHSGKTGGLVRLVEILKRLDGADGPEIFLISSDENYANCFRSSGIEFKFRPVKSKLRFENMAGLFLKSLFLIVKAFFVLELDFLESKDREVILYSSSDLFWEAVPAYLFKVRRKNIKWVQVIHHIYPDWKKRPGNKITGYFGRYLQKFSFRLARKKADKVIVLNNIVKNDLVRMGFPGDKIFISSNGIDIDLFEKMEKSELVYDGVFLGRLNHSKGIADLVEIWKNVAREIPGAKLAVIGGGSTETKNRMLKRISDFDLKKNVDLLGFLEDEKAYPILKSGKVFLFPSHEEGWGIAVAEAMACGLPVASWNLPAFREIFENYTFQIEENYIDKFSNQVIALLKDERLRAQIGKSGKEFIKKYSWEEAARKEFEIISQI